MKRVVVIGSSGSGKTTLARDLARRIDAPHIELDSIFHREGWDSTPDDEFVAEVMARTGAERWVVDGNYTSHGVMEAVWPRADTVVWLDLPRYVVMRRVVGRTLRRVITREKLWGKVKEPWTNLYSLDPYKNIIVWAWSRYDHTREKYEVCASGGTWSHARVHRLRTKSEVRRFLDSPA